MPCTSLRTAISGLVSFPLLARIALRVAGETCGKATLAIKSHQRSEFGYGRPEGATNTIPPLLGGCVKTSSAPDVGTMTMNASKRAAFALMIKRYTKAKRVTKETARSRS